MITVNGSRKLIEKCREKGSYNNDLTAPNQWDNVRDLNNDEKVLKLSTVNDFS